jgi:hypothetical protein
LQTNSEGTRNLLNVAARNLGLCTYDGVRKPAWSTMAELLCRDDARAGRGQPWARSRAATARR